MNVNKPIALMLVGPPKSGLSALFACLHKTGMMPVGFSEDSHHLSAESIDRLLFQGLDCSPYMIGGLPEDWIKTPAAVKTKGRIKTLLSRYFLEPRIGMLVGSMLCRTLPLWIAVCEELDVDPRVIVMVRHPWEAAQSLSAGEHIDLAEGHLLWLTYVREAWRTCQNRTYTMVTFDQLLADPITTLVYIGQKLSLSWTRGPWSLKTDLLNHIQPSLKRYHAADLAGRDKQCYRPYEKLYQKMRFDQHGNISPNMAIGPELSSEFIPDSVDKAIQSDQYLFCPESDLIDSLLNRIGQWEKQAGEIKKKQQGLDSHSVPTLYAQVVFPSSRQGGEYMDTIPLISDEWNKIFLVIAEPELLRDKPLIIKPLNTNGTVLISAVKLINRATGQPIWEISSAHDFDQFEIRGDAIRLPNRDKLALAVIGQEPTIWINNVNTFQNLPLALEIWIKVAPKLNILYKFGINNQLKKADSATAINWQFLEKLRSMTNVWDFQQQFKTRSLEYQKISTEDTHSLVKATTFWGAKIHLLPQNEVVSSSIYAFGLFEPELCSFFIDFLFKGAVVIDIGAHIGFFSILAADLVDKNGKIFAFEPTPSTRDVLKMNVTPYSQVTVIPMLAWSSKTQLEFHDYGIQLSAFNTAISDRLSTEQKILAIDNLIKVEGITLDSFCTEQGLTPNLVKIDAESSEMQVIQGMVGLLEKIRPVVTIEVGDMESTIKDNVPRSRDLLKFVMNYDYLPLNSIGGRYQTHEIKKDDYIYDNIIMVPVEKLPVRRPLETVTVQQGSFY